MYTLREAQNPSTTECKSYCKTQKPSGKKALKDMEISSLWVYNSTFLALFKHDLKRGSRQAALPPLQEHAPRSPGKFDDTHPNQRNFYVHPSTQVTVLRKGKQSRERNPLNLSGSSAWDILKNAVGLEKGQELDVAQPKWTGSLQCTKWLHKGPALSGYFSKTRSYHYTRELVMAHTIK